MRRACFPKVNDKGNAGQNFLYVKQKKPSCKPSYSIQLQKIFPVDVRIFPMRRYAHERKNIRFVSERNFVPNSCLVFLFRNRSYFPKRVDNKAVCFPFALRIFAVMLQRKQRLLISIGHKVTYKQRLPFSR